MRLLILTDHRGHSDANSLYALTRAMAADQRVGEIRVASRGTPANQAFFDCKLSPKPLAAVRADEAFERRPAALAFEGPESALTPTPHDWPDVVFLRIPHPVPEAWFEFLPACFGDKPLFNRPAGIEVTTSKAWLTTVPGLCAPMRLCNSAREVVDWVRPAGTEHYRDTVLKPLAGYGGEGIIRVMGGRVETPEGEVNLADWPAHPLAQRPYLAVDFLPGVSAGDKRLVVVDGTLIGSVLRVPAEGQWLCNVSQGGHAAPAEVTVHEQHIIATLDPLLRGLGVVMYGIDTLENPAGVRVLSEVNTMSVGGLLDLPNISGRTAVQYAAERLVDVFAAHHHP